MPRSWLRPCLVFLWLVITLACSTPISPYAQIDEDDEDGVPVADAGAGVSDAGGQRDAGPRDAGQHDAGTNTDCTRVPTQGVASLLMDGCLSRTVVQSCSAPGQTPQQVVNQHLANLAKKCESPTGVTIGVVFGGNGCPAQLRYDDARVLGRVSTCLQSALENERVGCSLSCALISPSTR